MKLVDTPKRSAAESLRRMKQLISPRVGIGRTVSQVGQDNGEPPIFLFGVEPVQSGPSGAGSTRASSGGAGLTYEEGLISALGELVEGYCAACVDPTLMIHGTYRELSRHHDLVHPARFALFSAHQHRAPDFPFQPFTENTPLSWVRGYSLVQEREVLVPAARVYMPYARPEGEPNLGPIISTGLAAGASLERAILSGLYECIERDAFTIFWMNDLKVRRVDLLGSAESIGLTRLFRERLAVPGYDYQVYDLTNDLGVMTCLVMLVSPSPLGPVYAIGAAARLDGEMAVQKALLEALQCRPYILHLIRTDPDWRPAADFANVTGFPHSCRLYTVAPQLQPHLAGIAGRMTTQVPLEQLPRWEGTSVVTEIGELVGRLRTRGYEAIVVDLTTPDIESLGIKAVRVLTPELQPLHGIHRWPFLGGRRLFEVPVRLGQRAAPPQESELSPYPHPFP